ncbi:MAG: hypothetical protein RML33_07910 [Acidobacteriota bacterium]|nr:hypothetical protein [Pyrinomonadaceae bacterium]MDW8304744.1 hypothetical protein [Acidobacteriota bacterium]
MISEFEKKWLEGLEKARRKAFEQGNEALAEYLELKVSNDQIRLRESKKLIDAFLKKLDQLENINLQVETKDAYQFEMFGATLTGFCLSVSFGIRQLFVEVGWTRLPKDGFMRKGALAYCRISHFGRNEKQEFLLVNRDLPRWVLAENRQVVFDSSFVEYHLSLLLRD